jgi:hypothetical protein
LNVVVAPALIVVFANVNTQWFELVVAELPEPLSGLRTAPEGTVSLVQWSPLGTLNATLKPVTEAVPVF